MELKRWFSANDIESEVLEASIMGSITVHDRTKMHILMEIAQTEIEPCEVLLR